MASPILKHPSDPTLQSVRFRWVSVEFPLKVACIHSVPAEPMVLWLKFSIYKYPLYYRVFHSYTAPYFSIPLREISSLVSYHCGSWLIYRRSAMIVAPRSPSEFSESPRSFTADWFKTDIKFSIYFQPMSLLDIFKLARDRFPCSPSVISKMPLGPRDVPERFRIYRILFCRSRSRAA